MQEKEVRKGEEIRKSVESWPEKIRHGKKIKSCKKGSINKTKECVC